MLCGRWEELHQNLLGSENGIKGLEMCSAEDWKNFTRTYWALRTEEKD